MQFHRVEAFQSKPGPYVCERLFIFLFRWLAQDVIKEMKRRFKFMNHQIEQLKDEITVMDHCLVRRSSRVIIFRAPFLSVHSFLVLPDGYRSVSGYFSFFLFCFRTVEQESRPVGILSMFCFYARI